MFSPFRDIFSAPREMFSWLRDIFSPVHGVFLAWRGLFSPPGEIFAAVPAMFLAVRDTFLPPPRQGLRATGGAHHSLLPEQDLAPEAARRAASR